MVIGSYRNATALATMEAPCYLRCSLRERLHNIPLKLRGSARECHRKQVPQDAFAIRPRRLPLARSIKPSAINVQNRLRSSRCETGGRPGERNTARPARSECRRQLPIATSLHRDVATSACIYPTHQRAVSAADDRSRRRLLDELLRQRVGQCGDEELLLVAQD